MSTQLIEGQQVTIMSSRGPIRRTIVKLLENIVIVGSTRDYEEAKMLGISRFSVGFPISDVLNEKQLDDLVLLKHNVQYESTEHGQAGPNRQRARRRKQPPKHQPHGRCIDQHRNKAAR